MVLLSCEVVGSLVDALKVVAYFASPMAALPLTFPLLYLLVFGPNVVDTFGIIVEMLVEETALVAFLADALDVVLTGVVWELFVAFAVANLPVPADMEPFP